MTEAAIDTRNQGSAEDPNETSTEVRKAALILAMMGTAEAAAICRRVDPLTAHRLIKAIGALGEVGADERLATAQEIVGRVTGESSSMALLAARLKEEVLGSRGGFDDVASEDSAASLERLALLDKADANLIWRAIGEETPQAIALIVRHLSPSNVAKLMNVMPEELRDEVTFRMAAPRPATAGALKAFARITDQLLKIAATATDTGDGSLQFVAEVIQELNRKAAQDVLANVKERSEEIGTAIEQMIFSFTDILRLPPPSLQVVLRNVSTGDLALALKGVPEQLRETVTGNLSKRAASVLQEEVELLGPVPATEAERAQLEIVQVARALETAGEISLEPGDVEYVE